MDEINKLDDVDSLEDETRSGLDEESDKSRYDKQARKVNYQDLLHKYGKRRCRKRNSEPSVYAEKGFSIQFRLSQAYRALQQQELTVAKPHIKPVARLSRRAVRRMVATERDELSPNRDDVMREKRVLTLDERLTLNLKDFTERGRKKRHEADRVAREKSLERKRDYLTPEPVTSQVPQMREVRTRPTAFWRHLMSGKPATSYSEANREESTGSTFITQPQQQKRVRRSRSNKRNRRRGKARNSRSCDSRCSNTTTVMPGLQSRGGSACAEWDDRRQKRRIAKRQQRKKLDAAGRGCKVGGQNRRRPVSAVIATTTRSSAQEAAAERTNTKSRAQSSQSNNLSPSKVVQFALSRRPKSAPVRKETPSSQKSDFESTKRGTVERGDGSEGEDEEEIAYRPATFLYRLTNCKNVSHPTTLKKILRSSKSVSYFPRKNTALIVEYANGNRTTITSFVTTLATLIVTAK